MIRIYQSTFGGEGAPLHERGDCFSACLASILELPLTQVPRFCELEPERWPAAISVWLRIRGLAYVEMTYDAEWGRIAAPELGYWILTGGSPRMDSLHSVVALGEGIVHDPMPGATQPHLLPEDPSDPSRSWYAGFLVPLNPRFVERHTQPLRDHGLSL